MAKKEKNPNITIYHKYNDFERNNKEVVAISLQDYNALPPEEKKKYKVVMAREKTTTKPPKDPTDHELLLMLVCEFREFKGYVIDNFKRIDSKIDEFQKYVLDYFKRNDQFQKYVLDMFKKHGWTK